MIPQVNPLLKVLTSPFTHISVHSPWALGSHSQVGHTPRTSLCNHSCIQHVKARLDSTFLLQNLASSYHSQSSHTKQPAMISSLRSQHAVVSPGTHLARFLCGYHSDCKHHLLITKGQNINEESKTATAQARPLAQDTHSCCSNITLNCGVNYKIVHYD